MGDASKHRDHGGGLDAASARFGGRRGDWLDLSTGINPHVYPIPVVSAQAWRQLPDTAAMDRLLAAARSFWNVPDGAAIVAAPGVSALIARLPALTDAPEVFIPAPTYNEHAAAFAAHGRTVSTQDRDRAAHVYVHPNNPDGRLWSSSVVARRALTVIDESFCDTMPEASHIAHADQPGVVVLKGLGKFWGLGGLRLGFAIGSPETVGPAGRPGLGDLLGPWPVSGPALEIGARALSDTQWAEATRNRLLRAAARLDHLVLSAGGEVVGGTTLFRTYQIRDGAARWQERLAQHRIWTRTFPYSQTWLRLGLPATEDDWTRLETAL